jgi:Sulfotransferase family
MGRARGAPVLDFVVIGAAKGGTTALFNLLRTHPQLYLPESKELPYFAVPRHDYYSSPAEFFADAFRRRGDGQLSGTVTPQYLYGALLGPRPEGAEAAGPSETIIPNRIRNAYPDARLIAILRDPVARARSYHRMSRMREHERRPFDLAIEQLLEPDALAASRARPRVNNSYVVLGEYARLLQGYLDVFPREQLLVLFHEDLERDPAAACEEVFGFLGVDRGFRPPNLGTRYNEGASSRRFDWLDLTRWQRAAARSTTLRGLWRRVPLSLRRRILDWFKVAVWRLFLWNRVPTQNAEPGSDPAGAETLARLRDHYREDEQRLRELLGVTPPWMRDEPAEV